MHNRGKSGGILCGLGSAYGAAAAPGDGKRGNMEILGGADPVFIRSGMDGAVLASGKRKLRLHLIASPLKSTLIGLGAGFLWLGSTAAVLLLSGTMRFAGRNEIPMLWLWIVSVFINSAMQELLVRGYLYQMLKANYHTAAAAAATTALFTFLHAGAFEAGLVPVLNVVTMSLLMTAVLEYTQSLLAPTLMHFIWNSIGSVILGGVALAEDYPHLYRTEFTGNVLLSGGAPKMEGSLVVLIVNLLLIAVFGILLRKKTHEHPAI